MKKEIFPKSTLVKKSERESVLQKTLSFDIHFGRVRGTTAQKAIFAKNLAVMLKAGLTISEALDIVIASSSGSMKKIMTGVLESVRSGNTLADSFARHPDFFSGVFVNATYAGETSGSLPENLEAIAIQLNKERDLVSKIKQALLYPTIVLCAAFVLGAGVSYFILPKIIPLFEGMHAQLPLSTQILITISYFVQDHGVALIIGIIVAIIFFSWLLNQKWMRPITNWVTLRGPLISRITRNSELARFCRNLNTLLKSGLSIDRALDITKETLTNYYYQKAVSDISVRIAKGVSLSDNLREYSYLFHPMLIKMIMVGEKSGQLEDTLIYLADFYELEVDTATKNLTVAFEPILLLIIGLVVAFLALSIITPIYNITGSLKG